MVCQTSNTIRSRIYIYNTSKVQYMHYIKGEGHIPPQQLVAQSSGTPTQSHMTDVTRWAQEDVNNWTSHSR